MALRLHRHIGIGLFNVLFACDDLMSQVQRQVIVMPDEPLVRGLIWLAIPIAGSRMACQLPRPYITSTSESNPINPSAIVG